MQLGVKINRNVELLSYPFKEVFQGFENVVAVRKIFGDKTDEVLSKLRVVLYPRRGYLAVDDQTGYILVSHPYLKEADERYLYLDVIHELVHVKQFFEGKELFDERYSYVDRPTEIEAYKVAVEEGRRIGMSDEELADYLRVEWITDEEFERLLKAVGVKQTKYKTKRKKGVGYRMLQR
ncbi:hypothetical protein B9Q02_05655 [Candidatus Marsarchaeota G1 archaeon BE_D]|jgi:hypothetical protein|uniref:Uncharacterized protein n=1 Tax=Candidatus Marsarchaeota G1 archaeon BE_D TaxID=1978156 RepID=A0A2R6AGZ5_9ARCH|nr:MAG: hypothetical protein B9Q02_05655 [Candidatus Marsarchaeota G1 archaeon BE_D]